MGWSTNQNAIFNFVQHGTGNAIAAAVAGSGKTTTLVHAESLVPGSALFLAFGKEIAEEMKRRGVEAKTFHSLVFRVVTQFLGVKTVQMDKLDQLIKFNFKKEDQWIYGNFCKRLVGLARQQGVGYLCENNTEFWDELIDIHNLELESDEGKYSRAIQLAQQLLEISNQSRSADFDDLLYFAVIYNLNLPKYDFIFVDEAQDTNAIQREIIKKLMHPGSRLLAVGDKAQAIYGFRGADSNSLSLIEKEFNCVTLPLDVSYRCPRSIVEYANQWVPEIKPAPDAPEGIVSHLNEWQLTQFQPHDLIVCRTTKPLISLAFKLISQRISAYVMGREIGQGMKSLINKIIKRNKVKSLSELRIYLNQWLDEEIATLTASGKPEKIEVIRDKVQAIEGVIEGLEETESKGLKDLEDAIDYLFLEKSNAVTLCTIHKSKGLEANRVYWLNRSQCPSKWAKKDWQIQQELNLCYVATTRAKSELYMIEDQQVGRGVVSGQGEEVIKKLFKKEIEAYENDIEIWDNCENNF